MIRRALFVLLSAAPIGCSLLPVDVDQVGICSDACSRVDECQASPPSPQFGNYAGESGEASLDCAANCVQTDAPLYGYSDCQLDCLLDAPCEQMNDCWKPKSELFAQYCLADRDIPAVQPKDDDPPASNGSNSGSNDADEVLDDPAAEVAVDEADFDVNFGDQPPVINGRYNVYGTIDESDNARPPGSLIDTTLCFWGQEGDANGNVVTYCEDYVPGRAAAPVTGSGNDFTVYLEYPG